MEDFNTHPAGHQIVSNAEVMKQVMVMNKASVREIMLQHERTFKEQVQDLHKLYEVQRTLMHKAKTGQSFFHYGASHSTVENTKSFPERHESSKQNERSVQPMPSPVSDIGFFRPSSSDRGSAPDQQGAAGVATKRDPKNAPTSSRKKIIDLEQLPEDDTDDEMEKSDDVIVHSRESAFPVPRYRDADVFMRDDTFPCSVAPSYLNHAPEPNFPSNPGNHEALNESSVSIGGIRAQNVSSNVKTAATTVLPQANDGTTTFPAIKKEQDWSPQGSNAKLLSSDLMQLHQQPTAQVLMRGSRVDYHQQWGTHQGFQNPTLGQHGARLLPAEDRSNSTGNWGYTFGEKTPAGLIGTPLSSSSDMPEDSSKSFTSGTYLQGTQYAAIAPAVGMVDNKPSGGNGHAISGFVSGSMDIPNVAKVQLEKNIWYQQNVTAQFPQYQQQSVSGQQIFPNMNHAGWYQSSQNMHQNLYAHQAIHGGGIQGNDTSSQIGLRMEEVPRGQAGGASPNNVCGIGNYFSASRNVQSPDFMKPPNRTTKNHGGLMELNSASPDEKFTSSSFKQDSSQDYLRGQEMKVCARGDANSDEIQHGRNNLANLESQTSVELGVLPMSSVPPASHLSKAMATGSVACENSDYGHNIYSQAQSDAESLSTKEHTGFSAQIHVSGSQNVKQVKTGFIQKDTTKKMDPTPSGGKGNDSCFMDATIHQMKEENSCLIRSGQGSPLMIPTKDGIGGTAMANEHCSYREHASGARPDETNVLSNAKPMAGEMVDVHMNSPCNVANDNAEKSHLEKCEVDNSAGDVRGSRDEVDLKPSAESSPNEGDSSAHHGGLHRKDDILLNRNAHSGTTPGQGSDLSTSSQLTMQAVSMQSSSTDLMPANMKQERECSSKETESSTFCDAAPNKGSTSSSSRKRKSASMASGGQEHPTLPHGKPTIENKADIDVDESSDNLQHISDDETLAAAAILLSFATKKTVESSCKYGTDDASRTTNKEQKHGSAAEHAPNNSSRQAMGGRNRGSSSKDQYEDVESSDCQAFTRLKVQCSVKRIDNLGSVKFRLKERLREEPTMQVLQQEHGKKEGMMKGTRAKVPKVVSIGNSSVGEQPASLPRSKQLNKLNAATVSVVSSKSVDVYGHSISHKVKDGHTLTGRRSSRGPPMASRVVHHENRARLPPPLPPPPPPPPFSEHYSDGDGDHHPDLEPMHQHPRPQRERNAQSPCKLDIGMKSKMWSDLNRRRSRTRTQAPGSSFKKSQR